MKKLHGYMRVSTKEQNEDRQRMRLREAGIGDRDIFLDKQSGKDFDRKNYRRMLELLGKRKESRRQKCAV